jgi:N-acetylglucosaminyl-diphospho-decaprenol L-rhamnosyltransferase
MTAELFILNYNGERYIANTIDSMLAAIARCNHACSLTIIDNVSTDQSVALISKRYPNLRLLRMNENRVLCSFNDAVGNSDADVVFLLNNDLTADPNFIDPILQVFKDKQDTFLVAAKSFLLDQSYEGGRSVPFVKYGIFGTSCSFQGFESLVNQPGITFSVGFGAFDRNRFLELGGFDDLYLPGRLEDADIALRAWRSGWKCYYEPKSILYHAGAQSFNERFGKKGTLEIAHKNTFLFIWKNIHDVRYWFSHWLFLLPRLFLSVLRGQTEFASGFFKAIPKMKLALHKRHDEKHHAYRLSDREVINCFRHGY